jgi:alpha-beta hydrolase superfamily lysophospholipase
MDMHSVTISNTQGYKLKGLFHQGKGKKLIIICNGYGCTKEFSSIRYLAEGLTTKGYDVFRFDFSGTGESEGRKGVFFRQMVDDISSVVDYFKMYKTVILLGGSLGAICASIASVRNPRVTHLITVNGYFGKSALDAKHKILFLLYRLATFVHDAYRQDYTFLEANYLPEKLTVPVFVIYTKADTVVDPIQSEEFYALLHSSQKECIPLPLERHDLTGNHDISRIINSIHI